MAYFNTALYATLRLQTGWVIQTLIQTGRTRSHFMWKHLNLILDTVHTSYNNKQLMSACVLCIIIQISMHIFFERSPLWSLPLCRGSNLWICAFVCTSTCFAVMKTRSNSKRCPVCWASVAPPGVTEIMTVVIGSSDEPGESAACYFGHCTNPPQEAIRVKYLSIERTERLTVFI